VADDPTYRGELIPLLAELIGRPAGPVLDLGCGEGLAMRTLPMGVIGCDLSPVLAAKAARHGPTVLTRLPDLGWVRDSAVAATYSVLVLEHLATLEGFFEETYRVTSGGGRLVVISNHPAYTPPGAGPLIDQTDGEVLWRWGSYFDDTSGQVPAGDGTVTFHHRPMGSLLNGAAAAGWCLERFEERGLSPQAVAHDPGLAGQEHLPRVIGLVWGK
jgi:SAM-dependent methyltransferase